MSYWFIGLLINVAFREFGGILVKIFSKFSIPSFNYYSMENKQWFFTETPAVTDHFLGLSNDNDQCAYVFLHLWMHA